MATTYDEDYAAMALSPNITRQDAIERVDRARLGSLSSPSNEYLLELAAQLHTWAGDVNLVLARRRGAAQRPTYALSPREVDVIEALDSNSTYEDIAAHLNLSINTVRHHVRNIYRKLGVTSRHAACMRYVDGSTAVLKDGETNG